jgi:hypothetical protein
VCSPESETSVPDVFNFSVIAHSDVAIDAHRECLLLADFVAKLFATLQTRNIESKKPASRIGYCALWLISESILRVGASKIVLQQCRAEAAQIHGRSHGGFRGQTGPVVLTPSFVESDRSRTS